MRSNAATLLIDPLERMAADFRRAGYPVAEITLREDGWVNGSAPDAVEMEGRIRREFFAPHIHWRLEDGRRFFGKPRVHLKRFRVRKYFGLVDREVVQEDRAKMTEDIKALILESCAWAAARAVLSSAHAPSELRQQEHRERVAEPGPEPE